MAKTNSGLVEYCKAQLGLPYWYGTFGQKASQSLYNEKKRQYPDYYTATDFSSQYGKRVHDCSGLVKGYLWSDTPTSTPKYNASQDLGASGLYNTCTKKGTIDTFDYVVGRLLFKKGTSGMKHTGVYIGNNKIIEAKGHAYGVVESTLNSTWTHWGQCKFIEEDTSTDTPKPVTNDLVFDNSICKKCTGIALKVCTQVDPLRLRKGPSTDTEILYNMPRGSTVTWKGYRSGSWLYVCYNGTWGFAHSDYLR